MDEHIKLTNGIREKIIKRLDYIEKLVWIIVAVTLGDLALNII